MRATRSSVERSRSGNNRFRSSRNAMPIPAKSKIFRTRDRLTGLLDVSSLIEALPRAGAGIGRPRAGDRYLLLIVIGATLPTLLRGSAKTLIRRPLRSMVLVH